MPFVIDLKEYRYARNKYNPITEIKIHKKILANNDNKIPPIIPKTKHIGTKCLYETGIYLTNFKGYIDQNPFLKLFFRNFFKFVSAI